MIRNLIMLMLFLLLGSKTCLCQRGPLANYHEGIFFEVSGTSIGYSLSYERVFVNRPDVTLASRIGGGLTSKDVYIPIGMEAFFLSGNHHIILAPTATIHVATNRRWDFFEQSDTFLNLILGMGYRYQSRGSRAFFQVLFAPAAIFDPTPSQFTEAPPELIGRWGLGLGFKL
ncbi:MAG: hypothetical protein AAFY71_18195 [Bacteroidota bacterium]